MNASGAMWLLQKWQQRADQALIVLAYHRVLEHWDEHHPGDIELISASLEDFRWQIGFLKRHFNPISLSHLIDTIAGRATLPRRPVLITFDDGFADNAELCAPVLADQRVPATFFVTTEMVGSDQMFWFDWVAKAMVTSSQTNFTFGGVQHALEQTSSQRRQQAGTLLEELKALSNEERHTALSELAECLDVSRATQAPLDRAMSAEQIRRLPDIITVASHSHTHPVLTQMPNHQIREELRLSKSLISQYTGRECAALAYPDGGADAVTREIARAATAIGYQAGFTYISGTNNRTLDQPLLLKRLHIERYVSRHEFTSLVTLPNLFHYPNWPDI